MNIFGEPLDNEIRRANDDVDKVLGPYNDDPILQRHYATRQPLPPFGDANELITGRRSGEERRQNGAMTDFEIVNRVELVRHWEKRAKRQRLLADMEYAMIVGICVMVITIAVMVFGPK